MTFTSFSALYDYESGLLGWKWCEFNVWFYQGKLYIDRSVDKIKIKHKIAQFLVVSIIIIIIIITSV